MKRYDRIVLNIPHATAHGIREAHWDDREAVMAHVAYLTDWHTDWLFGRDDPRIEAVRASLSRFVVDCERLEDDPLEAVGQGIIYTAFEGCKRTIDDRERAFLMGCYREHIGRLRTALTPDSILVDCHSFSSDKADVDICIGFNSDWSRPDDWTLQLVADTFKADGYTVAYNAPYSNSIAPVTGFPYPSVMIEVNKRCYMDEDTLLRHEGGDRLRQTISLTYKQLLR